MANQKSGGNFAQDRGKASEAGRKGGQNSQGNRQDQMSASNNDRGGQQRGSGNFADDRDRASEAGRKGGQSSHSGRSS